MQEVFETGDDSIFAYRMLTEVEPIRECRTFDVSVPVLVVITIMGL